MALKPGCVLTESLASDCGLRPTGLAKTWVVRDSGLQKFRIYGLRLRVQGFGRL